ncbi:hypothetical protein [Salinarimonas rosea]|uniref:hypothetical protein n=1 Tax=Salinarimonas rosea TaxID=552063 RepID=UPI0003F6AE33|nr:hypothetical protein [Salinarimonas rosea]
MTHVSITPFLRFALRADALASGAMGAGLAVAAGPLSDLLGLPAPFLRIVGAVCLAWAAVLWLLAARARIRTALGWAVAILNAVWVADSLLLLASGWVAPTALGVAFVMLQAVAVAAFALAQGLGVRGARALATA